MTKRRQTASWILHTDQEFRDAYQVMLAWSNPQVSTEVLVRLALLSGYFSIIANAANVYGFDYVVTQYGCLKDEASDRFLKVQPEVELILGKIKHVFK